MPLTPETFQNLERDIDDTGKAINLDGDITPRYGEMFYSLPKVSRLGQESFAAAILRIENMGGYVSAATLTELNTRTPSFNYQLARVQDTGNEYFWDPTATPTAAWKPTGKNWLNESKIYTDQQILNLQSELKSRVKTPTDISNMLIKKWPDTATPKFGDISAGASNSNASIGTYILANPANADVTIKRFSIISGVATGNIELRLYTRVGDTFTMKKSVANLTVSKTGLNEFGINEFLPFLVSAGDYLACIVKTNSALVYSGSSVNDVYYSNTSTGTAPIVGTAGKFNLKFGFFDTNGEERAQAFLDYLQVVTNQSEVNFSNILSSYDGKLGLTATPSAKSKTDNGAGHMCIGVPVAGFGSVTLLEVYSASAGPAQVGIYTRNGTAFTRKRFVDVTLSAGLNTIPINLAVSNGEYVGLRTTVVGQVEYENNTTGHQNMYVSTGAITDNSFNVSSTTPIGAFAYQLRFGLSYKAISAVALSDWFGKLVSTFGDSITWYYLQTFVASHIESGQLCVGYQSAVKEMLGCLIDNHGRSGWTMPQIYVGEISLFNFANTYATTITSGANDCRTGVAVGQIAPIGSQFDKTTYAGALQASIEHVISSNPACKIFLITPIRGWYNEYNTSDVPNTDPNVVGLMNEDYANIMKDIGKLYGLPVLDWFNSTELNDLNKFYYLGDNPAVFTAYLLHPKNIFFRVMGVILANFLKKYG